MKNLLLLLCPLFFITCQSGQTDPTLKKAAAIHQQAVDIEQEIKPTLENLRQQKNSLSIQGRTLTETEQSFVDYVTQIETLYRYWEDNHLEVPGFAHEEHEHHGHEHHDHDHSPGLELSLQDMLLVQQEFRDSIVQLQKYIQQAQGMLEKLSAQ